MRSCLASRRSGGVPTVVGRWIGRAAQGVRIPFANDVWRVAYGLGPNRWDVLSGERTDTTWFLTEFHECSPKVTLRLRTRKFRRPQSCNTLPSSQAPVARVYLYIPAAG